MIMLNFVCRHHADHLRVAELGRAASGHIDAGAALHSNTKLVGPAPQSGVGERRRRRWYGTSPSCCWSEKTPDSSDAALSSSSSSSSPSLEYSESASEEEEGVLGGAALRSSPCGGAPLCDSLPVVVTRPCQKRAACEREGGGVSEQLRRERKI